MSENELFIYSELRGGETIKVPVFTAEAIALIAKLEGKTLTIVLQNNLNYILEKLASGDVAEEDFNKAFSLWWKSAQDGPYSYLKRAVQAALKPSTLPEFSEFDNQS